jgi:hypothetical protein
LGVSYGTFVSIPVERNKTSVQAAISASVKRHAELKPKLKDPKVNGFLTAKLEPFWGRADNPGPVFDAVAGWAGSYSSQGAGQYIDHAGLIKAKDAGYLKARDAFAALIGDVALAFSKPVFQPVNEDFTAPTAAANDQALTLLALGLNGYAESMVAEGRLERAALIYELVFRQGHLLGDDVGIVQTMMGISLQALAFQSMVAHLHPNLDLDANQWAGLSAALSATTPTQRTLANALENDLAFGTAFLNRPRSSYDGDARPLRGAFLLPGFRARDLRVYQNFMGSLLDEVKTGMIQGQLPPNSRTSVLVGDSGPGLALLVPDYQQQSARVNLHGAKMTGMAVVAAISAYRAQNGKLPTTLADLDSLRLRAPGGVPWSSVKGIMYKTAGPKVRVGVPVDPRLFTAAGLDLAKAQKIEAVNSNYFSLKDGGYLFEF